MIFTILQIIPEVPLESQFEKLTNPILGILLFILLGIIISLYRDNKSKDVYIKELNASMLESAVKNLEVMTSLKNSINLDDAAHRVLEAVIRENNNLLKTLIRDLDKKN